jgi:hypothetical protein
VSQGSALDISKKAMSFAERNILSAFEFAEKVVQATDIQEMVRMQSLFVLSQMQALTEQAKDGAFSQKRHKALKKGLICHPDSVLSQRLVPPSDLAALNWQSG